MRQPRLVVKEKEGGAVNCEGCGQDIRDRYLLRVGSALWHQECLCCAVCKVRLDSQPTCFLRGDSVYCRLHYNREFGRQCAKCNRQLAATDWVRRAGSNVYHLACFACYRCQRQLSTGEQFALRDDRVLCKAHYLELVEGNNSKDEAAKPKTKRVRTTFTEEQLQVLQANFEVDSNPDGQDLERIAHITGLSKRVTQVWFQNSRARQKKHKEKKILNNNSSSANKNITSFQSKSINDFGPGQTVTLDLRWATADVSSPNSDVYSDQSEMDFEESMDAIYSAPTPL